MKINKKARARHAKRRFAARERAIQKVLQSGPGFVADRELRYYYSDYCNRLGVAGPESLPSHYRFGQCFFDPIKEDVRFEIKTEHDHLLSFFDFLDYATSSDAPQFDDFTVSPFTSEEIFSYSSLDSPEDFVLSVDGGNEFTVGSISVVSTEALLTVLLVGGMALDLKEELERSMEADFNLNNDIANKSSHLDQLINAFGSDGSQPVFFNKSTRFLKINAFVKLNLKDRRIEGRYIGVDMGNKFHTFIDEPGINKTLSDDVVSMCQDRLDEYAALFDFMKYSILFPSYFSFKLDLVTTEQYKPIGKFDNGENRPKPLHFDVPIKKNFIIQRVSAIRKISISENRKLRRFAPPQYRVRVSGFWRSINEDSYGTDKEGKPIRGKTWVKPHERWMEKPEKPKKILLKSRVAIARRMLEEDQLVKDVKTSIIPDGKNKSEQAQITREQAYTERKKLTSKLRYAIMQRDDFKCVLCGVDAAEDDNRVKLEVDHIMPISKGGKTVADNLRTLCRECNRGKSDSTMVSPGGKR